MNLLQFFEKQKELDDYITVKKGLQDQELLSKKTLALLVELGELANEWRGFKFWSQDQTPRNNETCKVCEGSGDVLDGEYILGCPMCFETGTVISPLLEEFIDCFHFMLSIGLEIYEDNITPLIEHVRTSEPRERKNIIKQFQNIYQIIPIISEKDGLSKELYTELFDLFFGLGSMLGFTWDQIESAYNEKHRINMQRQNRGY